MGCAPHQPTQKGMAENIIAVGIDLAKNAFAVHGSRRSCDSVKALASEGVMLATHVYRILFSIMVSASRVRGSAEPPGGTHLKCSSVEPS